jgi:GAF domain-containing protein
MANAIGRTMHRDLTGAERRQAFERFSRVLGKAGVRAALADLLSLTDYRFIGIFRFRDGKATAAVHVDRAHPDVLRCAEVPESATYCCYVKDARGAFVKSNALQDPRLTEHPARDAVPAYCGVPVMDPEGVLLGTLCLYDVVPREPEHVDLALLMEVASALAYGGHVPSYPAAAVADTAAPGR